MSFPEYGEIIEEDSAFPEYGEVVEEPSRKRSLLSAFPKGFIRSGRKINPFSPSSPIPDKLAEKTLEQFLPTQKGRAPEEILEAAGEFAPATIGGPEGLLMKGAQSLAGGLGKTAAKEMGASETTQDILGALSMAGPGAIKGFLSKALRPSQAQKGTVDFLKSQGFSDKEIVPLIQGEKKLGLLSKFSAKYKEKSPLLRKIKEGLGNIYEDIRTKGTGRYLEGKELSNFETDLFDTLEKIPKRHRRLVEKEIEELMKNPIDFTAMHDFNVAVNDIIKGATGGKASVGKLKSATHKAQNKLDSSLFTDLRKTDKIYSKMHEFVDKMTHKNWMSLFSLGDVGSAIWGLLTFSPMSVVESIGGSVASKYGARALLTKPRLQNLHLKMWDALKNNRMSQLIKLSQLFKKELEKSSVGSDEISDDQYGDENYPFH